MVQHQGFWHGDLMRTKNTPHGLDKTCQRCGTCCTKGGPALHNEDLHLFRSNRLSIESCITIRKGEPVVNPLAQKPEPAYCEIIKIAGKTNSWQCRFFKEKEKLCGIYGNRPVECSLLKCWDTQALTEVIYKNNVHRSELVTDSTLLGLIKHHEEVCSFQTLSALAEQKKYTQMSSILNLDLSLRQDALRQHGITLAMELFYFGRPMFTSAAFYNLTVKETQKGLEVTPTLKE